MAFLSVGLLTELAGLPAPVRALAEMIPPHRLPGILSAFLRVSPVFSHVLVKGYGMVLVYRLIELFAMKAALQGAKRTGLLLKLSE